MGKKTIGEALSRLLNARFIHNHLLHDVAVVRAALESELRWDLYETVRLACLQGASAAPVLRDVRNDQHTLLLSAPYTNVQPTGPRKVAVGVCVPLGEALAVLARPRGTRHVCSCAARRGQTGRPSGKCDMPKSSEETRIVSGTTQTPPNWSAWRQEAVRLMQERNAAWVRSYSLEGCPYRWSLDEAQLVFSADSDDVVCDICVIGSVSRSEGTFCWAWANETIPSCGQRGLAMVREFGQSHTLELLIRPQWPGGRPEGLEMAAVASRILDADGVWIEETGDLTLFFSLSNFRKRLRGD